MDESKNKVVGGTLYLVTTPIGNMSDITYRAVKVLREVDFIAAEDTRNTAKLLHYLEIAKETVSYHEHNKKSRGEEILARLVAGESCALVTDAGTPAISDPGEDLVKLCAQNNIPVTAAPGVSAAITALTLSAQDTRYFAFEGFLPVKAKALSDKLNSLKYEERTMIFYEAPRRIMDSMKVIAEVFGDRNVTIGRELTKTFETFYYGKASEMAAILESDENYQKGEMVVIVQGYVNKGDEDGSIPQEALSLLKILCEE